MLSLVPRGDFPAAAADAAVVDGGRSGLDGVPDEAIAITVEGKFADATLAVGRTARLFEDDGRLPVYFAPEDELCAVQSGADVPFRDVGAIAVGEAGDVLLAGGRDRQGRLVDDVVHVRDIAEFVTPLARPLPSPTTGLAVVPIGGRRFAVIGGATSDGRVLDQLVPIDLDAPDPIGPGIRIDVPGIVSKRSYHAAGVIPDGRVIITGGCTALDLAARCMPTGGSVLGSAFVVDARADPPQFDRAPSLLVARFGHEILVGRDGAVFTVGGRNHLNRGVVTIERWSPGEPAWTPWGRTERLGLAGQRAILGATLLEGGIIVVAIDDGTIGWVTDAAGGLWPSWCDGDATTPGCFHDERSPAVAPERRPLVALPGERILGDAWLLPFPMLGTTAADALDLSAPKPGQTTFFPPGSRTAATATRLADGTVLLAGGRDPESLEPVTPFLARLRPRLDGADERIPRVDEFELASLVLHDPERIGFDDNHLTLASDGDALEFPAVWAHVRAFRSASFRFDVTLMVQGDAEIDPPRPHIVLSQGALAGTSIRFDTAVTGFRRDAAGRVVAFSCAAVAPDFVARPLQLRVDVRPESIIIRTAGGEVVANCPGAGETPSAIGIGVSGDGSMFAYSPLLTRI